MATKVAELTCYLLFRLLVPLALLGATIFRFNGLSFVYAICLLVVPLLQSPSHNTIKGSSGNFLKALIAISSIAVVAHSIFHIVLVSIATNQNPYGSMFPYCSNDEKLARQIGLERLDNVPVVNVLRLVLPDVIILLVSILVYAICYKLLASQPAPSDLPITLSKSRRKKVTTILSFLGEFTIIFLLAASGIIVPSGIAAVYFVTFLIVATWWSTYHKLGAPFAYVRCMLLVFSGFHFLFLYIYQLQFFHEFLPHTDLIPRVLGLTGVIRTDCARPWEINIEGDVIWPYYVNPGILLLLYYTLAYETRRWYHRTAEAAPLAAPIVKDRRRRRQKAGTERQVASPHDQESLVGEENGTGYNTIETSELTEPIPSTSHTDDDKTWPAANKKGWNKRSSLVSIFVYIMKQSYVISLIAMMAWSITFHSWLTFVLLLWACLLWMIPSSRKACLYSSPFIVFYAEALLLIQYIYGFNLPNELPTTSGGIDLSEIGLKKFPYPCLQLALQILFTVVFWLTLRQFMRERTIRGQPVSSPDKNSIPPSPTFGYVGPNRQPSVDVVDGYDSSTMKHIGRFFWSLLCKYWIFVCAGMLLLMATRDVFVYCIIYLLFFVFFVLALQLAYGFWRATMLLFWWIVIIYSMFILCIIYTYQFKDFPEYWQDGTGLSNTTLHDLGLEQYDTAGLFLKLLTPTSFLIVVILQVHYFHKPFMLLSSLDKYRREDASSGTNIEYTSDDAGATTTDTEGEFAKKKKYWRKRIVINFRLIWSKFSDIWMSASKMLWRLAEIHVFKIMLFTVLVTQVTEISAIGAVYVILLAIFLPMFRCSFLLSHIFQIWTALVLLAKVTYQLSSITPDLWMGNCTVGPNGTLPAPLNETFNNVAWFGLEKTTDITYYIRNYLAILLVIVFESIVRYHQKQHFNQLHEERPRPGIIFPDIKRQDADEGLVSCIKFFANYFFYKYGLELCYIMSAMTIAIRVDAVSVLYAVLLGIFLCMPRRSVARLWPVYAVILAVLLPLQYLSCLGFPLVACLQYPWDATSHIDRNLELWLYLPDYEYPPNHNKLIADFFQLLLICLQWRVFNIEQSASRENYGGGSNEDILLEVEANTEIPVEDFTTTMKSYLDVMKYGIFEYLFWVTLAIVFITGTTRINLFSMGYVIAVFCFMWYGREFLLKPLRKMLCMWNALLGYTFLVLLLKAALQLVGCVYINYLYDNQCWIIQLLGLTCLHPAHNYVPGSGVNNCRVEEDDTGLTWDVVCFTFLLVQRRIYSCHYFRHIVAEIQAEHELSSKGADQINRILIREIVEQKEAEKEILFNIKKKMEHLKEKQSRLKKNYKEPVEHYQAIRSGDTYMFEEDSDSEDVSAPDQADIITIGMDKTDEKDKKIGPLQLITTAIDSGAKVALERSRSQEDLFGDSGSDGQGRAPGTPGSKSKSKYPAYPSSSHGKQPVATTSTTDEAYGAEDSVDEDEGRPRKETFCDKLRKWASFIGAVIGSIADWLIALFNKISKNYRHVAKILAIQMKKERLKIQQEKMQINSIEVQMASSEDEDGRDQADAGATASKGDFSEVKVTPVENKLKEAESIESLDLDMIDRLDEDETRKFESEQPRVYRLLVATYYVLISRSELLCYFLMILNQMTSASLLSLPLPVMVFMWGMLSVPRPSKTFWITIITYTEAIVVIKYLFQFSFFPWNDGSIHDQPFWPPRIIGVEQRANYASVELALLLVLFIHRSILKKYGLWKDADDITADLEKAEVKEFSPPTSPVLMVDLEDGDGRPTADKPGSKMVAAGSAASLLEDSGSITASTADEVEGRPRRKPKRNFKVYLKPFKNFYHQLTSPLYNAIVDVYAPMFFCDFIAFFIVVFGYWAFGPIAGGGDVTTYIQENRVPVPFLVMLITQFVLIIIDRSLFLRKNVLGKFIFQILIVIMAHVWMFFILPAVTDRRFTENIPAQLWYFTKCIYFGLSAYQIRSGYPTRILGNFLTKKYNYLNLFLFKGFLLIPFLLELRALMDWIWTDTTLAMNSWLQMEDIYANIYVLKCWRHAEMTYPTPRGQRRKKIVKYGVGGLLLFLIIFIIWFPLVLFSFANTVFEINQPVDCTAQIAVGGYQPMFKITAQQQDISMLSLGQYNSLKNRFNSDRSAISFITSFEETDITMIKLNGDSTSVWGISPPSQAGLIDRLQSEEIMTMEFFFTITRIKGGPVMSKQYSLELLPKTKERLELAKIINGSTSNNVTIFGLFPRFIRLGTTDITTVQQLVADTGMSNVSLGLNEGSIPNLQGEVEWWQVRESTYYDVPIPTPLPGPNPSLFSFLTLVTFNDRAAPAGFSTITGYGIIGLYVTFILLIGRFLRMSMTNLYQTIMFRELQFVDRMLKLCLDIYMVREMKEFELEEDLYGKLIFLYRSPVTLIKWTRPPIEATDKKDN